MILCANPKAQFEAHREEIEAAIASVLDSGWFILGEQVRGFESAFSQYVGVRHAVGVGSGTDALVLALAACGVERGDEVVTVGHTAVATAAAIKLLGAVPVFVDIEPDFYTIDPSQLACAVTERTKAIVPVHIYGHPADLSPILDLATAHNLRVIEDCAQAHGAVYAGRRVGSFGDVGCFSFYPTKNLGAIGDGGIVVTNDDRLAGLLRNLREYGWVERFISHYHGWNSRLDEVQAAILNVKLKYLDEDNASRAALARHYHDALGETGLKLPTERRESTHVFHLYVVRSRRRDDLLSYLRENGVGAAIHYPVPIHQQPAYSDESQLPALPVTERVAGEILSLPLYPGLAHSELQEVVEVLKAFCRTQKG